MRICPRLSDVSLAEDVLIDFCRDVVAIALYSGALVSQLARDFGILGPCLQGWLKLDEVEEDGVQRDDSYGVCLVVRDEQANSFSSVGERGSCIGRRFIWEGVNPK